jgi:hypothetical protein
MSFSASFGSMASFNVGVFGPRVPIIAIQTAAFGALTVAKQIPIVGITGTFATYSVIRNGTTLATSQVASSYTDTGLGDNTQYGPYTIVPYDASLNVGSPFTVTGGNGSGSIYTLALPANLNVTYSGASSSLSSVYFTWTNSGYTSIKIQNTTIGGTVTTYTSASGTTFYNSSGKDSISSSGNVYNNYQLTAYNGDGVAALGGASSTSFAAYTWARADPPTFSSTGSKTTTLACSGSFNKAYVTYTPTTGSPSPVSGTLITGTNAISQVYTTLNSSTPYTFYVYPVNSLNYPGSATGTNYSSANVTTPAPPINLVMVGASGGGGTIASYNGTSWVAYSATRYFFIFAGKSGSSYPRSVAVNSTTNVWVTVGGLVASPGLYFATPNTIAYSSDGSTWTGLGTSIYTYCAFGVAYNPTNSLWVSVGDAFNGGLTNSIAYSSNAYTWTGLGYSSLMAIGLCAACNPTNNLWVAGGYDGNSTSTSARLAYSTNGIVWTAASNTNGLGMQRIFSVAYHPTKNYWLIGGGFATSSSNVFAYSTNATNWTGLGKGLFTLSAYSIACNPTGTIWVAGGTNTSNTTATLNYSLDGGFTWRSTVGWGNLNSDVYGVTYSPTNQTFIACGAPVTGTVYNTLFSVDGSNWTNPLTCFTSTGTAIASY